MTTAVYPGSFDPVTNGHLDIIERASLVFDQLVLGVLENPAKRPLLTTDERVELLRRCTAHLDGIKVESFGGLTVDLCRRVGATVILKGLRTVKDFDAEMEQAQMNLRMGVETVLMASGEGKGYISSSLMKEVVQYGGVITGLVPAEVESLLVERLRASRP